MGYVQIVHGYASEHSYKIHPLKTTLAPRLSTRKRRIKGKDKKWYMGDKAVIENSKKKNNKES